MEDRFLKYYSLVNFPGLMKEICKQLAVEMEADKCLFFLTDSKAMEKGIEDKKKFSPLFYCAYPQPTSEKFPIHEVSLGLSSRVLEINSLNESNIVPSEENEITCIPDIRKSSYKETTVAKNQKNLSILCSPIVMPGTDYKGVFYLDATQKRFDRNDRKELLERIKSWNPYWKHWLSLQIGHLESLHKLVGTSRAINKVKDLILKFASADSSVLIEGETGTGKELVARALHECSSREGFMAVDCAAIPETLLESELFGYEKGSFTGAEVRRIGKIEQADKGTLFLDEIGEMSLAAQAKVLRVLQEKEFERLGGKETIKVDIRIIAATNKDLEKARAEGKFRDDLYYRLRELDIWIDPLRDRRDDIPILAEHFMKDCNEKNNTDKKLKPDLLKHWKTSSAWPGNVRELKNMIEKLYILVDKEEITIEDYEINKNSKEPSDKSRDTSRKDRTVEEHTNFMVCKYYTKFRNKKIKEAEALEAIGIGRTLFYDTAKKIWPLSEPCSQCSYYEECQSSFSAETWQEPDK